ncbi:MAG: sugar transferase [Ardenticatenaceae bacterium]
MTLWWEQIINRGWLRWLLMIVDVLLIHFAFFSAWWLRYELELGGQVWDPFYTPYRDFLPAVFLLTVLMTANLHFEELYDKREGVTLFDELYGIINATTTSVLLMILFFFVYQYSGSSRLVYSYLALTLVFYLSTARFLLHWWMNWLRQKGVGVTRTLIVGGGEIARTLMSHIVAQPELGYDVAGFVDDNPKCQHDIGRFRALGDIQDIPRLVGEHGVEKVIITLPWQYQDKILQIIEQCEQEGVQCRIVPDLFHLSLTRVNLHEIKGVPLIGTQEPALKGMNLALKRFVDLVASTMLLGLFMPILLLVALAIKLESSGAVIFKQTRVGRHGRLFEVYKFRSMYNGADKKLQQLAKANEADGPLFKIRNDPRITRVGSFIRKTSLDEFPQLWNVLKGDMSLVGPRPSLPSEVAQYEDWHHKRLEAPPGLTGLWQVSGRSDISFDDMMLLDIYYTEQWSLKLDLMILVRTVPAVVLQRGAY